MPKIQHSAKSGSNAEVNGENRNLVDLGVKLLTFKYLHRFYRNSFLLFQKETNLWYQSENVNELRSTLWGNESDFRVSMLNSLPRHSNKAHKSEPLPERKSIAHVGHRFKYLLFLAEHDGCNDKPAATKHYRPSKVDKTFKLRFWQRTLCPHKSTNTLESIYFSVLYGNDTV